MLVLHPATWGVVVVRQRVHQKLRHGQLGLRHQQCDVELREKLQGRCDIIPTIQTHTIASNFPRNCYQLDFSEYLGAGVEVNLACLDCRRYTASAGDGLFVISNSVRQSFNSCRSWVTALSNVLWGKPSSSTPSSSCPSPVLRPVSY